MPDDLMATSSKVSPRFPNVIKEDNKTDNGNARGISVALRYNMNLKMVDVSTPLPTKSSIHNQKNCIINTNTVMKKIATNGPINDFIISLSNFFNCW